MTQIDADDELGYGFFRVSVSGALEREFVEQAIPYPREHALPIIAKSVCPEVSVR